MSDALAISNNLPEQLSDDQVNFLRTKTPSVFVKYRAGAGSKQFAYVEVGYVMQVLNSAFGYAGWDWEYEIVVPLSYPNTKQIVINGKLTVRVHNKETGELLATIIKTASGGGMVKMFKDTSNPVDLADDVKSASADALKKAASLMGVASDIYYPNVYIALQKGKNITQVANLPPADQQDIEEADDRQRHIAQLRTLFALANSLALKGKIHLLGKSDEEKKQAIKDWLKDRAIIIHSFGNASPDDLQLAIDEMERILNG